MAAENGTLAIWEKMKPLIANEIAQQTRSCCQMVQMVVATPYNAQTKTVGVQEAFAATINIPVSGSVDTSKLLNGASVWVAVPFSSYSNAVVVMLGDGETGYAANAGHASTADNATNAGNADNADNAQNAEHASTADTAGNASMLDGKAPAYYLFAENLLDNTNFVAPYNQNGEQIYSGALYGIDRWVGMSRTQISLSASGVQLSNASPAAGTCFWQQLLPEERFAGSTENDYYTFAAQINGMVYAASNKLGSTAEVDFGDGRLSFLYSSANNNYAARITLDAGYTGSITIRWAALYKGQYTAESLPPYVAKETAVEQAQCQLYYRMHKAVAPRGVLGYGVCGSAGLVTVLIPRKPMAKQPNSVSIVGSMELYSQATGSTVGVSNFLATTISDDYIAASLLADGFTSGATVFLRAANDADACIVENANL